jgi:type II secretory pathway predicted ATPase ExeA
MYEEYFGLTEKPFSIQPDPAFLYWGRGHRLAYAMLEYGVLNHAGISVITGDVGCGKTTLVHRLLDQLSDTHAVALLSNIQQGRGELLSWVLMGFGQPFAGKSHVELFSALQTFFIGEYSKGRRVVLIIDEAQNLSVDQLEEIRMLSNINAGKDQLLQLILVGQPQLKDLLNRPDMLQLAQRVGSDFHLTPLTREEVGGYVDTRLAIAGSKERIFTERGVDMIAEHSRGVPRVINIICDTALVYAFSAQTKVADADIIQSVIRDKADYGVFGLATDQRTSLRSAPTQGPRLYVGDDSAPLRARRELSAAGSGDQARMTAPRRRVRAVGALAEPSIEAAASAFAATSRAADAAVPEPEGIDAAPPLAAAASPARTGPRLELAPERGEIRSYAAAEDSALRQPAAARAVIGVIVTAEGGAPEQAIRAVSTAGAPVFVAQSTEQEALAAARAAGAEVVEVADRALTPGRARNAGYRHLKKLHPDLAYVQFVEAGVRLHPDWLGEAARFMERRPEIAAVEGVAVESAAERSPFNRAAELADAAEAGEVQTIGSCAFVRADAFEGAGGFRGDLVVNETRDLCIRLRRRGAHIWRLDAAMCVRDSRLASARDWWRRSARRGYEYAHGAALHGAPPDRLFRSNRLAALLWGACAPAAVLFSGALVGVFAAFAASPASGLIAAAVVLALGVVAYVAKIAVVAYGRRGKRGALGYAFWLVAGYCAEAAGVWRYHFGGSRGRQPPRAA